MSCRCVLFTEFPWTLWIFTTDMKGAGTDAQVFLQIYGERGKSDEMKMENNTEDSFEQGQVDKFTVGHRLMAEGQTRVDSSAATLCCLLQFKVVFVIAAILLSGNLKIEMPDIGRLQKLRIWHEKRHPFAGWHLAKVRWSF